MLRIRSSVFLPLLFVLLSTGCANVVAPTAPVPIIPREIRDCRERPEVPPADADDRQLAAFIVELDAAYQDCRDTVIILNDVIDTLIRRTTGS